MSSLPSRLASCIRKGAVDQKLSEDLVSALQKNRSELFPLLENLVSSVKDWNRCDDQKRFVFLYYGLCLAQGGRLGKGDSPKGSSPRHESIAKLVDYCLRAFSSPHRRLKRVLVDFLPLLIAHDECLAGVLFADFFSNAHSGPSMDISNVRFKCMMSFAKARPAWFFPRLRCYFDRSGSRPVALLLFANLSTKAAQYLYSVRDPDLEKAIRASFSTETDPLLLMLTLTSVLILLPMMDADAVEELFLNLKRVVLLAAPHANTLIDLPEAFRHPLVLLFQGLYCLDPNRVISLMKEHFCGGNAAIGRAFASTVRLHRQLVSAETEPNAELLGSSLDVRDAVFLENLAEVAIRDPLRQQPLVRDSISSTAVAKEEDQLWLRVIHGSGDVQEVSQTFGDDSDTTQESMDTAPSTPSGSHSRRSPMARLRKSRSTEKQKKELLAADPESNWGQLLCLRSELALERHLKDCALQRLRMLRRKEFARQTAEATAQELLFTVKEQSAQLAAMNDCTGALHAQIFELKQGRADDNRKLLQDIKLLEFEKRTSKEEQINLELEFRTCLDRLSELEEDRRRSCATNFAAQNASQTVAVLEKKHAKLLRLYASAVAKLEVLRKEKASQLPVSPTSSQDSRKSFVSGEADCCSSISPFSDSDIPFSDATPLQIESALDLSISQSEYFALRDRCKSLERDNALLRKCSFAVAQSVVEVEAFEAETTPRQIEFSSPPSFLTFFGVKAATMLPEMHEELTEAKKKLAALTLSCKEKEVKFLAKIREDGEKMMRLTRALSMMQEQTEALKKTARS